MNNYLLGILFACLLLIGGCRLGVYFFVNPKSIPASIPCPPESLKVTCVPMLIDSLHVDSTKYMVPNWCKPMIGYFVPNKKSNPGFMEESYRLRYIYFAETPSEIYQLSSGPIISAVFFMVNKDSFAFADDNWKTQNMDRIRTRMNSEIYPLLKQYADSSCSK